MNTGWIGRSQGATIFWGLVSSFFAASACFYFLQNHENESSANKYRDEVLNLQEERDSLTAERDRLQKSISDSDSDAKSRDNLLDEKETRLKAMEVQLTSSSGRATQAKDVESAAMKEMQDAIKTSVPPVTPSIGKLEGRTILSLAGDRFFTPADATLTLEGSTRLEQMAQALAKEPTPFFLVVETYTDGQAELPPAGGLPRYTSPWDLTGARAAALSHFFEQQTAFPAARVLVVPRGDSDATAGSAYAGRHVDISVLPVAKP